MECPDSTFIETARRRGPKSEPQLPWPQLHMTGQAFGKAVTEMEGVFGKKEDTMFGFPAMTDVKRNRRDQETWDFIKTHRLAPPKRPGQISHVSAGRACRLLFDWVEGAKVHRQDAERQRQAALFSVETPASAAEPATALRPQASFNQLYCKDLLILLTCIFGFESTADLRQLTGAPAYLVLFASLLHRLFYAPPGGFSFEPFREEATELLVDIGRHFGVEFDSAPREPNGRKT